jgi:hypothetical protein
VIGNKRRSIIGVAQHLFPSITLTFPLSTPEL